MVVTNVMYFCFLYNRYSFYNVSEHKPIMAIDISNNTILYTVCISLKITYKIYIFSSSYFGYSYSIHVYMLLN